MRSALILLALILTNISSVFAQNETEFEIGLIGFYNLENLFDTLDTEGKRDHEFTPEGRNKWNAEKYAHKLDHLSQVISEIGTSLDPRGLAILGVAEVETIEPLQDLITKTELASRGYEAILEEGPDRRGIDVGLVYDPERFEVESWETYTLHMEDSSFHTRDQLLVTGDLLGERVHVIVAHWPSRSGGAKRSEPKRMAAAELGRTIIDSILTAEPGAEIVYMGDLNDDPVDKSLKKSMRATGDMAFVNKDKMYNPMYNMYNKGIGSLAWRDTWNLFDQILLSPGLSKSDEPKGWVYHTTRVFNMPYMANATGNFKGYPYRTFAGGAWTGGYSDHFPVYVVLKRVVD